MHKEGKKQSPKEDLWKEQIVKEIATSMSLFYRFFEWYLPNTLTNDKQRIHSFLVLFQFVLFPILIFFVVLKTRQDGITHEVLFIAIGAFLSIFVLFSLRFVQDIIWLIRLGGAYIIFLAWYEVLIGGGAGVAFVWFYFHGPTSFFILGKREGSWWCTLSILGLLPIMYFDLGSYHYTVSLTTRFALSYIVVCLLSYALEEARYRYHTALQEEKQALEDAFEQIQALQRLMPICASCKKIRDDQGYWHQVDNYIGNHANIEFTQGLCPNCKENISPQHIRAN